VELCDVETGRTANGEGLSDVQTEVISRDRAWAYARSGPPRRAVQVADRFHRLRNLREALEHVLARHESMLDEAFR
jgi:hypothetical protein